LRAVAAVRRLGRARYQAAFPQEIPLDRVRRDENVRRLGVEMVLRGPQESETFFGNLKVTGTGFRPVIWRCTHIFICRLLKGLGTYPRKL
jgi:hypothetical protein